MPQIPLTQRRWTRTEYDRLVDQGLFDGEPLEPLIYEHPPFEALLMAPLGALPYKTAYLIWGLVNVVIWLTLPWLLPRPVLFTVRTNRFRSNVAVTVFASFTVTVQVE